MERRQGFPISGGNSDVLVRSNNGRLLTLIGT